MEKRVLVAVFILLIILVWVSNINFDKLLYTGMVSAYGTSGSSSSSTCTPNKEVDELCENKNPGDKVYDGCRTRTCPYHSTTVSGETKKQCEDGIDNELDGVIDADDPGCLDNKDIYNPNDNDESDKTTQCQDGLDNDNDGKTDTDDWGCYFQADSGDFVYRKEHNDETDTELSPKESSNIQEPTLELTAEKNKFWIPLAIALGVVGLLGGGWFIFFLIKRKKKKKKKGGRTMGGKKKKR